VGVGLRRCGGARRCDFGPQALQLGVERRAIGEDDRQLLVALAQRRFELCELFGGLFRRWAWLRQLRGVERERWRWPLRAGVGVGEPVADVEQLAHGGHGVFGRHALLPVYGAVAERVDDARLAEDRLANSLLQRGLVDDMAATRAGKAGGQGCSKAVLRPFVSQRGFRNA
jgi:hypothetical protein